MISDGLSLTSTTALVGSLLGALLLVAIPILLERARVSSILSRYPVVNPKWDAADRKSLLHSSQSVLLKGLELVSVVHGIFPPTSDNDR